MLPFTPRLKKVFVYAEGKAHQSVTALDLLHGILALGDGAAVGILKSKGIVHNGLVPPRIEGFSINDNSAHYAPSALTALANAITESAQRSHELVGVEAMLAGILVSPSPEITAFFTDKKLRTEDVLAEARNNI